MTDLNKRLSILAAALSPDARQAASTARTLGFAGVLFDAVTPALDLTTLSQTGRREFRHVISSNNLQLVGLRHDLGPSGFSRNANVERALAQLEKVIETAAGLASPLVVLDLGPLPPAPPQPAKPAAKVTPEAAGLIIVPEPAAIASAPPPPPPPELSPADRAFASHLDVMMSELCARADRYSVTLAVRSDLAGLAALDNVLRRVLCPWFGIDLDPVGVLRDPWPLDEILSRLGPLVRHVRLRDAALGESNRTRSTPIGQGNVNWRELLSAFDAAGYRQWLTVDPTDLPDRAAAAAQARAYLTKL